MSGIAYVQWPQIRGRLVMNGIADPMRQLPTLYALLDVVELMLMEGIEKREERDRFISQLYLPPVEERTEGRVPRGFSPEEEMAAFDDLM